LETFYRVHRIKPIERESSAPKPIPPCFTPPPPPPLIPPFLLPLPNQSIESSCTFRTFSDTVKLRNSLSTGGRKADAQGLGH
jgi:hypothetical protein